MWNQSRHDLQNTARTDAINHGTGRQLWRLSDTICYSYSSPAIDINDTVYIYCIENIDCDYSTLYAINPDGTIKWQFQSIDTVGEPYWGFNGYREIIPTIGPDGTIYYADGYDDIADTNFVYAINPDGTLKWMYSIPDIIPGQYHVMGGFIKIYSDTAYVIDYDHIYALDAQTGTLKWSYAEPNEYDFYDGFSIYNGFIYIISSYENGTIYKIDVSAEQLIWTVSPDDTIFSGISINDNGIFVMGYSADRSITSGSYAFAKFDINDGHNIWTRYIPIPSFNGYIYNYVNSFVALDSTSVYYSVDSCYNCPGRYGWEDHIDGRVFKYDFNGNLIWESATGLSSISPVIDGDGYIYTGDAKKIVKLNPLNGDVVWLYPITDRWTPSSLAIGNIGTIYFISNDTGYIDAIASEIVELPIFGDGSDGDVIISQNSTLTRHTNFRNLTINEGVELNTAGYRIRVQDRLTINGIIHNNGGGGSGGYGPNRIPSCDCINCNGGTGMGGHGYGGNGGYGNNDRFAGGGGGTYCGDAQTTPAGGGGPGGIVTSLAPPSLSDLVNYGFPYIGGGGGGGGSSNQYCNCANIDVWIFGGGGSGGNGGGTIIIQAYEIIYGPNGYIQANGIDGETGLTRMSHSRHWFFDCCPNFIPLSGGCKTGGFNCADYVGWACPEYGGWVCPEYGGGGGGGGGGAQFIIHNRGFDLSRHQVDPGKGGTNPDSPHPGQDGIVGNIYTYQVGAILQLYVTISTVPDQINSGETSQITIHVIDENEIPIEGTNVTISTIDGILDPISGITDTNGDFISTYTAPTVTDIQTFIVEATVSKSGYTDGFGSTQIIVNPPTLPPVQAGPSTVGAILVTGLLIGVLISKKCKDYKTKEECKKANCEWIDGKCVEKIR